ncbi:hypothetical protein F503_04922 [Ophiostoma piceae UAMH 11346]|uniref:Uncharacterized protein n=1 Tax=Ophiostoma piceae (strain UAMH 11346) TaxID=1262450 RepID=S3BRZ9_OPHP1|nr:hypothetical protein F503_04922 [Ophiostoma piceae UAMH 11346]
MDSLALARNGAASDTAIEMISRAMQTGYATPQSPSVAPAEPNRLSRLRENETQSWGHRASPGPGRGDLPYPSKKYWAVSALKYAREEGTTVHARPKIKYTELAQRRQERSVTTFKTRKLRLAMLCGEAASHARSQPPAIYGIGE